ncbi:MAG TPA: hypothetical protein DEQ40_13645, partial [Oxalobacteraceae bacterium]|nr:hypothetical protein [Oxalobacteraceae bacterium]
MLTELHARLQDMPRHFVNDFYTHLAKFEETRRFIPEASCLEHLKQTQTAYFDSLTAGDYGSEYIFHRLRVGVVHQHIGLEPKWYIGAYSRYLVGLLPELRRLLGDDPDKLLATCHALQKIAFLDMGLAIDTYIQADRHIMLGLKRYAEDIIASLPAGLIVVNDALKVRSVNRSFREIFGLKSRDDVSGYELEAILARLGLREEVQSILADGTTLRGIDVTLGKKRLRVAIAGIRLAEEDRHLLVVVEDVTEEQRLREETRAHATRYRDQASLLDKATDAIIVRGIDHRILFWNKGAERLYGWTPEEAMRISPGEQIWDDPAAFTDVANRVLDHGEWRGEITQRRKDGSTLIVESQRTLVRDENEQPQSILVINTDITQRKATDEKIRHLALYDTMTGLPNRTLFMDRIKQVLANAERYGRRLAILFMDLNRFKEINDTQGHGVGDQVLIEVARRFQATLRKEETLARLTGDEFVVVAEAADQAAAVLIAERLQRALAEPIAANGHTFSVGVSIGIAFYPEDGVTIE